jgi:hypothetical protein
MRTAADTEPVVEGPEGPPLDRRWTPAPAAWFVLDQLAHLSVLVVAWAALLAGADALDWWSGVVERVSRSFELADVQRALLVIVVIADLVIVNVRVGWLLVAMLVRAPAPRPTSSPGSGGAPSPARIGATIGVLERLLICALVLSAGATAVGLVVAAKTIARFKQLEDRLFAEYYLLGTLASVTLAVTTSLIAERALA